MLDDESTSTDQSTTTSATVTTGTGRPRRRAASRPAGPPPETPAAEAGTAAETAAPAKRTRTRKSAAAAADSASGPAEAAPAKKTAAKRTRKSAASAAATTEPDASAPPARKRTSRAKATATVPDAAAPVTDEAANSRTRRRKKAVDPAEATEAGTTEDESTASGTAVTFQPPSVVFQPPAPSKRASRKKAAPVVEAEDDDEAAETATADADEAAGEESETDEDGAPRRRRRRGGRGRRGRGRGEGAESGDDAEGESSDGASSSEATDEQDEDGGEGGSHRRRRRRKRGGSGDEGGADDPPNTVVRVREPRSRSSRHRDDDEVTSVRGSTRIEAKRQRRREGREAGRRRPPVLTESEFLARREAVERVMVVRQKHERTQIAVLEDGVLVEHHISGDSSGSMIGSVYLGRVQNVLPSMEAAFVDIGRGRNAVLYAGEVNWDAAGLEGQPKRIEYALKSGDPVLVQVTKDPVGQKGARLTSQISLPGRYLVYVPEGSMNGISRKLPDTERTRLKSILKRVVAEHAGVIVRTAAEGASEEELTRDVERLSAQWEDIDKKAKSGSTSAPTLLYGEPDLTTRVVRDVFNEDFTKLVVSGDEAWGTVEEYVGYVAPDLVPRLERWTQDADVFQSYRVDEQLLKALDRKVYLPSGGSLVIDRTEAMTVVDVNTGKFTGQGGNLEETVTKNNLEAAEEIVRQLRLRDVGGIIVVDFIDMVLESNRDLVLRRLLECLGRDRTKHQVAEVTSLGLVQMTRKRVGQGLLEVFSEPCDCCNGRGLKISLDAPSAHSTRKNDKGEAAAAAAKIANAGKPKDAAAEDSPDGGEKPAKAKRSRAKKTAAAGSAATASDDAALTGQADPDDEPAQPAKRSRSRKKAAVAPEGPAAAEAASAEPAPRARRLRAKKTAVEPAAEGSV